jgi:hypothetical protein
LTVEDCVFENCYYTTLSLLNERQDTTERNPVKQQRKQQQQSQNTTGGDNTNHSEQADDNKDMSVEELLYSTTSFHAIIKPGMNMLYLYQYQ